MPTTNLTNSSTNNSTSTNFDKIALLLEQYYQKHPITPLKQLRIRRSVLVKDMYVLDNKLFDLEQSIFVQYQKLKEQSKVDLAVDTANETLVSKEQMDYFERLTQEEAELSELYKRYEKEFLEINSEISKLQTDEENTFFYNN
jgi:type III secretory pathway component EscV